MNLKSKITLVLVAVSLSFGMLPMTYQPVSAQIASPQTCTRWHTVQRGEYLVKIAELYETNWYTIAAINKLENPNLIFQGQRLCVIDKGFSVNPPTINPVISSGAAVVATAVKEDQVVTLQGKNLAADTRYGVYLGKYKADPFDRLLVGSILTDKSGSFKATYDIPKKLYDVLKIRVSITNPKGVSSYNWFINATSSSYTGGIGSPELSLSVQAVNKSDWVKVSTNNLPANVTFNVFMNKPGATEKKAILVGTLHDAKGGSVVATYDIPDSFQDLSKLEIYAVNNALDMTVYATFNN